MNIEVHRNAPNDFCIVGDFQYDGKIFKSMELPLTFEDQENVPDKTCIPAGTYEVRNLFSDKWKRMMPHVMGVLNRTGIEIHPASEPENILGCTAIGRNWFNQKPSSSTDVVINESDSAFTEFLGDFQNAWRAGEKVTISYTNDF